MHSVKDVESVVIRRSRGRNSRIGIRDGDFGAHDNATARIMHRASNLSFIAGLSQEELWCDSQYKGESNQRGAEQFLTCLAIRAAIFGRFVVRQHCGLL